VELQTLKRIAASTALAFALTVSLSLTGPRAFADDHGDCRAKIERAQTKLDEAVRRHGDAERERCWNKYHGYWSTQDQRWHTDRDWDDHDHDHDNDQH